MKTKIAFALTLAGLATIGTILQVRATKPSEGDITLEDLYAFTNTESNTEGGSNNEERPPEFWHYVEGRYIKAKPVKGTVLCVVNGSVTVDGHTTTADAQAGFKYIVSLSVKNCDGEADKSWCDQRQVGVWLVDCQPVETK